MGKALTHGEPGAICLIADGSNMCIVGQNPVGERRAGPTSSPKAGEGAPDMRGSRVRDVVTPNTALRCRMAPTATWVDAVGKRVLLFASGPWSLTAWAWSVGPRPKVGWELLLTYLRMI